MTPITDYYLFKPNDVQHVVVRCPGCGNEYHLDHSIDDQGAVTPSLDCPNDGCTFHDNVVLVDWDRPAMEASQT